MAFPGYQVLSDILFRPDSECSHTVQFLDCSDLTLQSLSPGLALYDPFGVDVPLNCDTTINIKNYFLIPELLILNLFF